MAMLAKLMNSVAANNQARSADRLTSSSPLFLGTIESRPDPLTETQAFLFGNR